MPHNIVPGLDVVRDRRRRHVVVRRQQVRRPRHPIRQQSDLLDLEELELADVDAGNVAIVARQVRQDRPVVRDGPRRVAKG
jgi:hypothetical protein